MKHLTYFLATIITFCNCYGLDNSIKVELKSFERDTFLIFYHNDNIKVKTSYLNGNININFNENVTFSEQDIKNISHFAKNIDISNNNVSMHIDTKTYEKSHQVNGETFTAIRLDKKSKQKKEELGNDKDHTIDKEKVSIKRKGNSIVVSLQTGPNVGCAAFSDSRFLYVVLDGQHRLNIPNNKYKIKSETTSGDAFTMIKIWDVPTGHITLSKGKDRESWDLVLNSKIQPREMKSYNNEDLQIEVSAVTLSKIFEIEDRHTKKIFKVVTINTPLTHVSNVSNFPNALRSYQGMAFLQEDNQDLQISYTKPYIVVSNKQRKLGNNSLSTSTHYSATNTEKCSSTSHLNFILNEYDGPYYSDKKSSIYHACIKASTDLALYKARTDLAKFFFNNKIYHESIDTLRLVKDDMPEQYSPDYEAHFLEAVTLSIVGRYNEAMLIYTDLAQRCASNSIKDCELEVWTDFTNYKMGNKSAGTLNLFRHRFIENYPDELYWPLVFAELDFAFKNDYSKVDQILKTIKNPISTTDRNNILYYKALYHHKSNNNSLAVMLLDEILSSKVLDSLSQAKAEVLKIMIQKNNRDISVQEAIQKLESARLILVGSEIEIEILDLLARYNTEIGDNINALRAYYYKYNIDPKATSNIELMSEMNRLYLSIFTGEYAKKLSDFEFIAMFKEFTDIVPIGAQGDIVMTEVANRMNNLGLFDTAIDILEHQTKYRLTGEKKILTSSHLALTYIMNSQPDKAIETLNWSEKENTRYEEYLFRLRLKALAYTDMKQYDKAIECIKDDNDPTAIVLKKHLYFLNRNWVEYINIAENGIFESIKNGNISNQDDIIKLALAYSMTKKLESMSKIASEISKLKDQKDLSQAISFINGESRDFDSHKLRSVLSYNGREAFMNKCKEHIFKNLPSPY